MQRKIKELDWVTEIRLEKEIAHPVNIQRVMMFSGFASSPEVLRDLGMAIHQRLPATVLIHGLPRHDGNQASFYDSRAWHYWRESEELFLRYWKEKEKPVALVGYSTGANVVLTIAARHPSKVAGVILLSPYLRARSASRRFFSYGVVGAYYVALPLCAVAGIVYLFRKRRNDAWPMRRVLNLAAGSLVGVAAATKVMSSATISLAKAPNLIRNGEEVRAPHFERVSIIGGSTLVPFQLITRWLARKTTVPVTYIFGEKDSVVDVRHGVMMAKKNPRANLFVLSNAQHRVVTEQRTYDIVCSEILKCFDENAESQLEFSDVDILLEKCPHSAPQTA
jgi:pimeloyl-ACP methyl ester carboxylesterase